MRGFGREILFSNDLWSSMIDLKTRLMYEEYVIMLNIVLPNAIAHYITKQPSLTASPSLRNKQSHFLLSVYGRRRHVLNPLLDHLFLRMMVIHL